MNRIYTIYHIPKFVYPKCGSIGKVGVSYRLTKRINQNLKNSLEGFTKWEVLEEHTDVYEVSDREQELQKQYGYKVDKVPYWKTIKIATKESTSKGGKIGGKIAGKLAVESGNLLKAAKKGGKTPSTWHVKSDHMKRMGKLASKALKKPILQYDKDKNFIKEWECATYAANTLNLHVSTITKVCKGKFKQTGGYIFKYKEV